MKRIFHPTFDADAGIGTTPDNRSRLRTFKNRFLHMLFVLLGFSLVSCSPEDTPCEYGTPYVEFEVSGQIVDEAGNPIRQIEVRLNDPEGWEPAVTRSAEDGSFTVSNRGYGMKYDYLLEVVATDTDGPENGGSFATMKTTIRTEESDFKGADSWLRGKAKYRLHLELNREESTQKP